MAVYTLLGAGVQGLSPGVTRLIVDVVTFRQFPEAGQATPTNYFHLGLLRQGVQGSYGPSIPVDAASMYVDLDSGVTSLGYSLFGSSSVRVTEQFGIPVGNPARIALSFFGPVAPGGTANQFLVHTVPANRTARMDQVVAYVDGSASEPSQVQVVVDARFILLAYPGPTGSPQDNSQTRLAVPLLVFGGESLTATGYNFSSVAKNMGATFLGVEFDAKTWVPA